MGHFLDSFFDTACKSQFYDSAYIQAGLILLYWNSKFNGNQWDRNDEIFAMNFWNALVRCVCPPSAISVV